MPTDPFVNPDLDDKPRQQQNLPAGVAYPPARKWTPKRPGDVVPGERRATRFGNPGPNVGYAYTLAARARSRLRLSPHEHAEDVIAVVAEIAGKRAALFGRAPVIGDIDVAVELLGYDGTADDAFVELRSRLTHDAAHEYRRRRQLVDSVPEDLVRLRGTALAERVGEWRAQARLDPAPRVA